MNWLKALRRLFQCNGYQFVRASRNDSLTLAAQVGKPQAAGLKSSRIAVDRKAHVIQMRAK